METTPRWAMRQRDCLRPIEPMKPSGLGSVEETQRRRELLDEIDFVGAVVRIGTQIGPFTLKEGLHNEWPN